MNRRKFLQSSALAGVALATPYISVRAARAAQYWDMVCEYPDNSFQVTMDHFFADRLADLTDGELQITIHAGGSLGYASRDQFDAVSDGAVQLADTVSGAMTSVDPLFKLPSLPFLARGAEGAKRLWDVAKPYYDETFKTNGQKLLYGTPDIPSGLWADKPILSVEDLKGLRIRTYDVNGTITLQAAGAAPIQVSWADVVPQLATNAIDAVLTGMEGGVMLALWEHVSDYTELDYARPLHMGHINLEVYEELSPKLQAAVDQAAADTVDHIWTSQGERVASSTKKILDNGVTITSEIPTELADALTDAASVTRETWLKEVGPKAKEILKAYGV